MLLLQILSISIKSFIYYAVIQRNIESRLAPVVSAVPYSAVCVSPSVDSPQLQLRRAVELLHEDDVDAAGAAREEPAVGPREEHESTQPEPGRRHPPQAGADVTVQRHPLEEPRHDETLQQVNHRYNTTVTDHDVALAHGRCCR